MSEPVTNPEPAPSIAERITAAVKAAGGRIRMSELAYTVARASRISDSAEIACEVWPLVDAGTLDYGADGHVTLAVPGACPLCGPGYRYGDDGCQHSPAAASPGTPDGSVMDDIATLAMHCKTYADGDVWDAARRVMKLVAVQFDSSVAPLVAAVEVKELRAALAARDAELARLRDQLVQLKVAYGLDSLAADIDAETDFPALIAEIRRRAELGGDDRG